VTKHIAIMSGKGGTGKTTVAASFAYLAQRPPTTRIVIADADVDAANLHLLLGFDAKTKNGISVERRPSLSRLVAWVAGYANRYVDSSRYIWKTIWPISTRLLVKGAKPVFSLALTTR